MVTPLASAAGSLMVYDDASDPLTEHATVSVPYMDCTDLTSSGYDLTGPVFSGTITLVDNGSLATNKKINVTDLVVINKTVLKNTTNADEYDVTLTIDVDPVEMTYYPPEAKNFIFVLDITSSMVSEDYKDYEGESNVRMYYATRALKNASKEIWDANASSTITVIPFSKNYYEPLKKENTVNKGLRNNNGNTLSNTQYNYYKVESADKVEFYKAIDDLNRSFDNEGSTGVDPKYGKALIGTGGTNAESGLWLANKYLNDSVEFSGDNVVILITDGNSNYYDKGANTNYNNLYPASVSGFGYSRRGIIECHRRAQIQADIIKDPTQGNALLYVMGIGHLYPVFNESADCDMDDIPVPPAQYYDDARFQGYNTSPIESWGTNIMGVRTFCNISELYYNNSDGQWWPIQAVNVWTYLNTTKELKKLASDPSFYMDPTEYSSIGPLLVSSVNSAATKFYVPVDNLYVQDSADPNFTYVAGSYSAMVYVDDNPAGTDITSDFDGVTRDVVSVSGNTLQFQLRDDYENQAVVENIPLTKNSHTKYVITYRIELTGTPASTDHLHVSDDNMCFVNFTAPDHTVSDLAVYDYPSKNTYYLPFNTPTIPIDAVAIDKIVSTDGIRWGKEAELPKGGGDAYYKVTVTNGYPISKDLAMVADELGGTDPVLVYVSANDLLVDTTNVTLTGGNYVAGTGLTLTSGESATLTYTKTYTSAGTYKNMAVIEDDDGSGVFKNSTATITVPKSGSGGGEGNATIIPKNDPVGFEPTVDPDVKPPAVDEPVVVDAGCPVFHWWWLYALLLVLLAVQVGFLYKRYKDDPDIDNDRISNKWWIITLVWIFVLFCTAVWFYVYYCQLSDWWILLPVLLTLLLTPVMYLYNKYVPGRSRYNKPLP
ncbi:vWA domain-containing protein [Methanolapillus africanus]|uniref:vWA domain-containing protein n=1 Tax=Methanolapillus africanus TaxID=3028297 RepID=UPI0030B90DE3